jgi:hypothetical protein
VLDFVLAAHVLALDEARFRDSEVSAAARADGREVEVLGDVLSEVGMAVDHSYGPFVEFYIVKYKKILGKSKPQD